MTYNTKLGICIPTYRRPEQLIECVISVINSARAFDVPVFIVDDSGDDSNTKAIDVIKKLYFHIVYVKNEENLGIDRNILKAVDCCNCEYAWLLGEDDRMLSHGISTVLDIIDAQQQFPFIYVNYISVDNSLSTVLRPKSLDINMDQIENSDFFLKKHAWSMGFIGACIVNKSSWSSVAQAVYLDTYFAHVGIIMETCRDKQVYMIAKPLVLNRCGSPETFSWKKESFSVVNGWSKLMQILAKAYGEKICEESLVHFERAHGINSVKFLCYLRADNIYTIEEYNNYISTLSDRFFYKRAAWIISLMPGIFFKILRYCITKYRKIRYWGIKREYLDGVPKIPNAKIPIKKMIEKQNSKN